MNKTWIVLAVMAFLSGPFVHAPEVHASNQPKSEQAKAKAAAKKSDSDKAAKKQVKKQSKSDKKKAALKSNKKSAKKNGKTAKPRYHVQAPPPPLRAMREISAETLLDDELAIQSSAALVVDQKSGEALYAKNVDIPTAIASITKLMTAMVVLDADLDMEQEIVVNEEDVDRLKGTGSRLALGTRLTREELLHLALIASENRAASALSRSYPGGRSAFVAAMNRKAGELGMHDSHFVDGTGLHSGNRATASDLVKMVDAAYRYPFIRESSGTGSYDVSVPGTRVVKIKENGKVRKVYRPVQRHIAFNNTNSLTRNQEWDIGVSKTGYINEAGHCLVMQTRIADQRVIIVLLDSVGKWGRIGDAQRIRKWLEHDHHVASRPDGRKET